MADAKIQWEQCLASSGRNPSKCKKFEAELKKLEVSRGENYCIQQTIDLMQCTNKGKTCGDEFFSMRECNRSGGALFSKTAEGNYVAEKSFRNRINFDASTFAPPASTLEAMRDAGDCLARKLNIDGVSGIRI